tara:strand:+ start:1394 stop:3097 length:1704 start_codon:yes stop_codon:yes gene_type:complete
MTVKSSGSISFKYDIEAEFGQARSGSRRMGKYRKNHVYGDMKLPLDTGIPRSGPIKFSDFYGKGRNAIVDAYSGSWKESARIENGIAIQINAYHDCDRYNVGYPTLKKKNIDNCNTVIIHVNQRIGSVHEYEAKGQDQVAFKFGTEWNGASVKLYVGENGLIAGAGGQGGKGGVYAWHGYDGGPGNSAIGIDYPSAWVTVMNSTHPLRVSSGTGGAIVGGCGGAGGGGAAGANNYAYREIQIPRADDDKYERETVTIPNPDGEGTIEKVVNKLDGDGNPILKPPIIIQEGWLERYWSGGGGGGGGAGLPGGDARTRGPGFEDDSALNEDYNGGGPTGKIYAYPSKGIYASAWNGDQIPGDGPCSIGNLVPYNDALAYGSGPTQYRPGTCIIRAKTNGTAPGGGGDGKSLTASNLTNSGRGGNGGGGGRESSNRAIGGDGGDGGDYSGGLNGMVGETGSKSAKTTLEVPIGVVSNNTPTSQGPAIIAKNADGSYMFGFKYFPNGSASPPPVRNGGTGGQPGYAIVSPTWWSRWGPDNHDADRVMGKLGDSTDPFSILHGVNPKFTTNH